jgi:hypothetical protein
VEPGLLSSRATEDRVKKHRPLGILSIAAATLALALACGGGDEPAPQDEPTSSTPSLGDLLGAGAPAGQPTPSAQPDPLSSQPPTLPDLSEPVATREPEVRETPECTQARAELKAQREAVDARRVREIASAERALASGQLAMQNCIKTSPCNEDAKLMAAAQEQEEASESAYQAAMQRVAQWEAGLFQYEQAVDRACGRR